MPTAPVTTDKPYLYQLIRILRGLYKNRVADWMRRVPGTDTVEIRLFRPGYGCWAGQKKAPARAFTLLTLPAADVEPLFKNCAPPTPAV